ncbi:hypothetical protein SLEP1_g54082 [Rubroshorea leprosula]|uniref:Uncharacterized protein n=1 Tax=Rubroshorea leprosula TaxID=152421 RepID=A0AAV5ME79_9ROSI|nr:hypothetical protein SLEP1_g54082 [Rubroshorea leprosula]
MLLGTKFLAFSGSPPPCRIAAGFFLPPGLVLQLAGNSGFDRSVTVALGLSLLFCASEHDWNEKENFIVFLELSMPT